MFGSDGGGEAFGFDLESRNKEIVSLTFIGMNRREMNPISDSVTDFRKENFWI